VVDGILQQSINGSYIVFGCRNVAANLSIVSTAYAPVAARFHPSGEFLLQSMVNSSFVSLGGRPQIAGIVMGSENIYAPASYKKPLWVTVTDAAPRVPGMQMQALVGNASTPLLADDQQLGFIALVNGTMYAVLTNDTCKGVASMSNSALDFTGNREAVMLPGMCDGIPRAITQFVFQDATTLWTADARDARYNVYRWDVSVVCTERSDSAITVSSGVTLPFITGRWETGAYILYMSGPKGVYAYNTVAQVSRIIVIAASQAMPSEYRGIAFAPSDTFLQQLTPSITPTFTASTTRSSTPSLSSSRAIAAVNQAQGIAANSILVVRVGDGTTAFPALQSSTTHAVYVDEFSPDGVLVSTTALPTSTVGQQYRCTLMGGVDPQDSFAQLSTDGRKVIFPCVDAPINASSWDTMLQVKYPKTIAVIGSDRSVSTTTHIDDGGVSTYTHVRSAVSTDGNMLFYSSMGAGVRYVRLGSTGTTLPINSAAPLVRVHYVTIYANTLYGYVPLADNSMGYAGVVQFGAQSSLSYAALDAYPFLPFESIPLPRSTTSPGGGQFVFENLSRLYMIDQPIGYVSSVFLYAKAGSVWSGSNTSTPDGQTLTSIAGRNESGIFTLYVTTASASTFSCMYRFVPSTGVFALLAKALARIQTFRSVTFPPTGYNVSTVLATISATATPSPSAAANAFFFSDLLVVRIGNGSSALGTAATVVNIDAYDTTRVGKRRTSLAMPNATYNTAGKLGCYLYGSNSYPNDIIRDGSLSLSTDGTSLSLACYDGTNNGNANLMQRVLTTINTLGATDTRTVTGDYSSSVGGVLYNATTSQFTSYGTKGVREQWGLTTFTSTPTVATSVARMKWMDGRLWLLANDSVYEYPSMDPLLTQAAFQVAPTIKDYPVDVMYDCVMAQAWLLVWRNDTSSSSFKASYAQLARNIAAGYTLNTANGLQLPNLLQYNHLTGRQEGFSFVLYVSSDSWIVRVDTVTTYMVLVAQAASFTLFKGISFAPMETSTYAGRQASVSPSPSHLAAASASPSSFSIASSAAYQADSILLLAVGNYSSSASVVQPLILDEVKPDGTVRSSQTLPYTGFNALGNATSRCTSSYESLYEPTISVTSDGRALLIACHDTPIGSSSTNTYACSNSVLCPRIIATILANGSTSVAVRFSSFYAGGYFRGVAGLSIRDGFWVSSLANNGTTAQDIRYMAASSNASTTIDSTVSAAAIRFLSGKFIALSTAQTTTQSGPFGLLTYVSDSQNDGIPRFQETGSPAFVNSSYAPYIGWGPMTGLDFVFQTSQVVWILETRGSTGIYVCKYEQDGISLVWDETHVSAPPNKWYAHSMNGRTEGSAFVLYIPTFKIGVGSVVYRFDATSKSYLAFTSTWSASKLYKAIAFPMEDATMATPTPSTSFPVSPSPAPMVIHESSLLVLVVDSTGLPMGSMCPISLMEVSKNGSHPVTVIPVRSSQSGSHTSCTLGGPASTITVPEGLLSASPDGRLVSFACYEATPGSSPIAAKASARRVVAVVDGTGYVSTSTILSDTNGVPRSAFVWQNGSIVLGARAVMFGDNMYPAVLPIGIASGSYNLTSDSSSFGAWTAAYAPAIGSSFYAATSVGSGGILSLTDPFPDFTLQPASALLPGFDAPTTTVRKIAAFVFQDALQLWVADGRDLSRQLYYYTRSSASGTLAEQSWAEMNSYTIQGGGVIYGMVGEYSASQAAFVLYISTDTVIVRFNTARWITVALASAPANSAFRGMAFAPLDSSKLSPTVAATITPSATLSGTVTQSKSPLVSGATNPATLSQTPSSSATPSGIYPLMDAGNILLSVVDRTGNVSIVEMTSLGTPVRTFYVPPNGSYPCVGIPGLVPVVLDTSKTMNTILGRMSLSSNGTQVTFTCLRKPYSAWNSTANVNPRVVLKLDVNGNMDATQSVTDAFHYNLVASAATHTGLSFYAGAIVGMPAVAANIQYQNIGLRKVQAGALNSTALDTADFSTLYSGVMSLKWYNFVLYGCVQLASMTGIVSFGSASKLEAGMVTISRFVWTEAAMKVGSLSLPLDFEFENDQSVWLLDDRRTISGGPAGANLFNYFYFQDGYTQVWLESSGSYTLPSNKVPQAVTKAFAGSAVLLYIVGRDTTSQDSELFVFSTLSGVFSSISSLPYAAGGYVGVVIAPQDLMRPSRTASASSSASITRSITPSATPSTIRSAFQDGSLLVVRVGYAGNPLNTTYVGVFLDELHMDTGQLLSSTRLPCVLSGVNPLEGKLRRSLDLGSTSLTCYSNVLTGSIWTTGVQKYAVIINPAGIADISSFAWTSGASAPLTSFYDSNRTTMYVGAADTGLLYAYKTNTTWANSSNTYTTIQSVNAANGSLYAVHGDPANSGWGVFKVGSAEGGSPSLPACCVSNWASQYLPGMETSQLALRRIVEFEFQYDTLLWVADTRDKSVANIYRWDYNPVLLKWQEVRGVSLTTAWDIYSLTSTTLSGHFTLLAAAEFYIFRYDTVTDVASVLKVATQGTAFRGVALVPIHQFVRPTYSSTNTLSASRSLSPVSTPTNTMSNTITQSNTGTPSTSFTFTRTPSRTPSQSITPFISGTPLATPSRSMTAAITNTPQYATDVPVNVQQSGNLNGGAWKVFRLYRDTNLWNPIIATVTIAGGTGCDPDLYASVVYPLPAFTNNCASATTNAADTFTIPVGSVCYPQPGAYIYFGIFAFGANACTYNFIVQYAAAAGSSAVTPSNTQSTFNTPSNTASMPVTPSQAVTPSKTGTVTSTSTKTAVVTSTFTPVYSYSSSNTVTNSPSASTTATTSVTPSFSPIVQKFSTSSLLALRVGTGAADPNFSAGNKAVRVYLDEIYPDGTLVQSIDTNCFLTASALGDGILSVNYFTSSTALSYACYEASAGSLQPQTNAYARLVGKLLGDGTTVNVAKSSVVPMGNVKAALLDASRALINVANEASMSGLYAVTQTTGALSSVWSVTSDYRATGTYSQVFWFNSSVYFVASAPQQPSGLLAFTSVNKSNLPGESTNPSVLFDYNNMIHVGDPYPTLYGVVIESSVRVWSLDSRASIGKYGLFRNDYDTTSKTWSEKGYTIPCAILAYQGYALVGRQEDVGWVLYFSTYKPLMGSRVYRFITSTGAFTLIRHSSNGLLHYKSVHFPPVSNIYASATPTRTPSSSNAPSFVGFQPGNLVVVRVGSSGAVMSSYATKVWIDEVDVLTGIRVQFLNTSGFLHGQNPLATFEGQLYRSSNGTSVTLVAYSSTAGSVISAANTPIAFTVLASAAVMTTNLQVSSTLLRGASYESTGILSYGSAGNPWWQWQNGYSVPTLGNGTAGFQPTSIIAYAGKQYCTYTSTDPARIGVYSCGTINQGVGIEVVPFFRIPIDDTVYNPTGLAFESSTALWVTDEAITNKAVSVLRWTYDSPTGLWAQSAKVFVTNARATVPSNPAVYGLTSNVVGRTFMLYVSTVTAIYSINSTSLRVKLLSVAENGVEFRGIALAPVGNRAAVTPTSSRTSTPVASIDPSTSAAPAEIAATSALDPSALIVLRVDRNTSGTIYNYYGKLLQIHPDTGGFMGTSIDLDLNNTRTVEANETGCRFTGPYTYGDSHLLLSDNGAVLTLPCYKSCRLPSVNMPWLFDAAQWSITSGNDTSTYNTYRLVARIMADGSVDYSTTITSGWNSTYVIGAATLDGGAYFVAAKGISTWMADSSYLNYVQHGIQLNQNLTVYKSSPTTFIRDVAIHGVKMYGGRLYVSVTDMQLRGLLRYAAGYFVRPQDPEIFINLLDSSTSGAQQRIYNWEHQDDLNVWVLDPTRLGSQNSIFAYTKQVATGTWSESRAIAMPDGVRPASFTGRMEAEWCMYVVSYSGSAPAITNRMWRYSSTSQRWELIHSSYGNFHYKSISLAPTNTTLPFQVASPTASMAPKARVYNPNNVLIVQLGDGSIMTGSMLYTAQLVEVDIHSGYAFSPVTAATNCSLPGGSILNAGEGQLSRSVDGRFVTFVCYKVAQKGNLTSSSVPTVAVLEADGALTAQTDLLNTSTAIGALTENGNEIWVAFSDGVNGLRLHQRNMPWSASQRINTEKGPVIRALTFATSSTGQGSVYATVNTSLSTFAVARLNTNMPKAMGSTFSTLPGMQSFSMPARNPFTFVFQSDTQLWISDPRNPSYGSIWLWTYVPINGDWEETFPFYVSPYPVLYLAGWWVNSDFVMFATSSTVGKSLLYKINTTDSTSTLLTIAPKNYVYRGVSRVPDGTGPGSFLNPTRTPSGLPSASPQPSHIISAGATSQAIDSTSILALGSCSDAVGALYTNMRTSKVCIYEIGPAGNLLRIMAAPTNCTLASTYLEDGIMSLSGDGKQVIFACYAASSNVSSPWSAPATSVPRVAAALNVDGTITILTQNSAVLSQQPVRSATTANSYLDTSVVFSGGSSTSPQGLSLSNKGSALQGSAQPLNTYTLDNYAMHFVDGQLHVLSRTSSWIGIRAYGTKGSVLSSSTTSTIFMSLEATRAVGAATVGVQPKNFHVQSTGSRVWLLDSRSLGTRERLFLYEKNAQSTGWQEQGRWVMPDGREPTGITGRPEGAVYMLYITTAAVNLGSNIFAFDTQALAFTTTPFYTTTSQILLKGISLPPFDPTATALIPSATPTSRPQAFESGSLLVSRHLTYSSTTIVQDLIIDEVRPQTSNTFVSSFVVSTVLSGSHCAVPANRSLATIGAGSLSLSDDGRSVVFACFDVAGGQQIPGPKNTIAIDSSQSLRRELNLFDDSTFSPLSTVGSPDSSGNMRFWTAFQGRGAAHAFGIGSGTAVDITVEPLRFVALYKQVLYGSTITAVVRVSSTLYPTDMGDTTPLTMTDTVVRSPWGFWFQNDTQLWVTDDRTAAKNLYYWTAAVQAGGSLLWSEVSGHSIGAGDVQSTGTSKAPLFAIIGKSSSTGVVLYVMSYDYVYAFNPASDRYVVMYSSPGYTLRGLSWAPMELERRQKTPTATAVQSISPGYTPSVTLSASPSRSKGSSDVVTPTPSATPAPPLFLQDSIILLRVGDGVTTLSATQTAIIALEEYAQPGFMLRQIRTLPTTTLGNNRRCTLPGAISSRTGMLHDGQLHLSPDGNMLTLACYDGPIHSQLDSDVVYHQVVGAIFADGTVDTTTRLSDFDTNVTIRSAISSDSTGMFLSSDKGGIHYVALGDNASVLVADVPGATNGLGLFRDTLYASASNDTITLPLESQTGIVQIGARGRANQLPSLLARSYTLELPLHQMEIEGWRANPLAFVWEGVTRVWVLDMRSGTTNYLFMYEVQAPLWAWEEIGGYAAPGQGTPLSMTGRGEIDGFRLYVVTFSTDTMSSTLYQFLCEQGVWKTVAQSPPKRAWKGVALPPMRIPTATPTASQTSTPSNTASSTMTPSNTISSTSSPTTSQTASNTASNTASQTSSWTRTTSSTSTPSNTISSTQTSTASVTVTTSSSMSASVTAYVTNSPTPSCTASWSASNTATQTSSVSVTPSITARPTASSTQKALLVEAFRPDIERIDDKAVVQSMLHDQASNVIVLSAAMPARTARIKLSISARYPLVSIIMNCSDSSRSHEWALPAPAPANEAAFWLREPFGAPDRTDLINCSANVRDGTGDTTHYLEKFRYDMKLAVVGTRWADFSDLLTVEHRPTSAEGDVIKSTAYGNVHVLELQRQLCCPYTDQVCDVAACTISNSSADPAIVEAASSIFRTRTRTTDPSSVLSLVVTEQAQITLVSSTVGSGIPGPYAEDTRVYIGNALCSILWVSQDGYLLTISAPASKFVCGNASAAVTADCGYKTLRVEVPSVVGPSIGDTQTMFGTTVECPPVCPGVPIPGVTTAPVAKNDRVLLSYVKVQDDNSVIPLASTVSAGAMGLYYTTSCAASGFDDLGIEICSNVSNPDYPKCSFGAGGSCKLCPEGAICPGGYRAWPLPGYFTVLESAGSMMKCPEPDTRCVGWDAASGVVKCGTGYRTGGYLCMTCSDGFYIANDGSCKQCPPSNALADAVVILLVFMSYVSAGVIFLYACCIALLKFGGGSVQNAAGTFVNLLAWTFLTLQTVAQLGKSATHGLPDPVRSTYQALLAFHFEGASIPAACLGQNPLQTQLIVCGCLLTAIGLLVIIYGLGTLFPPLVNHMRRWKFFQYLLKALSLLLFLAYAPVSNGLMEVLMCRMDSIPVRTYLLMQQEGLVLTQAGITLSDPPTRNELDIMLQVPLLMADTSQACYEGMHSVVYPITVSVIVIYYVFYPMMVVWFVKWRAEYLTRGKKRHRPRKRKVDRTACHEFSVRCCGHEYAYRTRVFARRSCPCWSHISMVGWDPTAKVAAWDDSPVVLKDLLLRPYTKAQFRPFYRWFILVDALLQCFLTVVGVAWKYPTGKLQVRAKALVLCIGLLTAAWLYETRRPFRAGRNWKSQVKAFSLLVCAFGAIENALLVEYPISADGQIDQVLVGWTFVLVTGTVMLLLLLMIAFVVALFAEQKLDKLTPKINLDDKLQRVGSFIARKVPKVFVEEWKDGTEELNMVSPLYAADPLTGETIKPVGMPPGRWQAAPTKATGEAGASTLHKHPGNAADPNQIQLVENPMPGGMSRAHRTGLAAAHNRPSHAYANAPHDHSNIGNPLLNSKVPVSEHKAPVLTELSAFNPRAARKTLALGRPMDKPKILTPVTALHTAGEDAPAMVSNPMAKHNALLLPPAEGGWLQRKMLQPEGAQPHVLPSAQNSLHVTNVPRFSCTAAGASISAGSSEAEAAIRRARISAIQGRGRK
jgi:hypothetical protein